MKNSKYESYLMDNGTTAILTDLEVAYANVYEPFSFRGKSTPKYQLTLLIKKDDSNTLKVINSAIDNVINAKDEWMNDDFFDPEYIRSPLMDGDKNGKHVGFYYITPKSNEKPIVIAKEKAENGNFIVLKNPKSIKRGTRVNVMLGLYPYDVEGNRGVAMYLNTVQKERDAAPSSSAGVDYNQVFNFDRSSNLNENYQNNMNRQPQSINNISEQEDTDLIFNEKNSNFRNTEKENEIVDEDFYEEENTNERLPF
ncbi:MAG: DUF2815 family protein [Tissierellia bacterium]|nr:DUF2815 family protein [Tissierellia bacterium]